MKARYDNRIAVISSTLQTENKLQELPTPGVPYNRKVRSVAAISSEDIAAVRAQQIANEENEDDEKEETAYDLILSFISASLAV